MMTSQDPQHRLRRLLDIAGKAIIPTAALGLIGFGAWRAWPPAGFIVVGSLLWIDLTIDSFRRRTARTQEGTSP